MTCAKSVALAHVYSARHAGTPGPRTRAGLAHRIGVHRRRDRDERGPRPERAGTARNVDGRRRTGVEGDLMRPVSALPPPRSSPPQSAGSHPRAGRRSPRFVLPRRRTMPSPDGVKATVDERVAVAWLRNAPRPNNVCLRPRSCCIWKSPHVCAQCCKVGLLATFCNWQHCWYIWCWGPTRAEPSKHGPVCRSRAAVLGR